MKQSIKTLKNSEKAITLISLVVTIIVLLILAGISISMLSGDNGILQRATDAKTITDNAQIKERIQLAYHSALAGGQGSYTKESLENELEKEFENDYNVDDSDNINWILTAQGQSITIPAGIKLEQPKISGDWSYNHSVQTVSVLLSNGETLILNIGDYIIDTDTQVVEGFDGHWRVLGVENGKLLLTTSTGNVMEFFNSSDITKSGGLLESAYDKKYLKLSGVDGYINGVDILNNICENFEQSRKFENGRSIKINDVNTLTGFNPKNIGINDYLQDGEGTTWGGGAWKYETNVLYKMGYRLIGGKEQNRVFYSIDDGSSWNEGEKSSFVDLNSSSSLTRDDEPVEVKNNYYNYYASTLTSSSSGETVGVNVDSIVYDLLFNIDSPNSFASYYWLASPMVKTTEDYASWNMAYVSGTSGWIGSKDLKTSNGGGYAYTSNKFGVRPVVTCSSEINIKYISSVKNNEIKIFSIGSGEIDISDIEEKYEN